MRLPQDLLGEQVEEVARRSPRDARRPALLRVGLGPLLVCWPVVAGVRRDRDGLAPPVVLALTSQVVIWLLGTDVRAHRSTTPAPEGLLVRRGPVRPTRASRDEVCDVKEADRWHERARALPADGREVDLPGLGGDDLVRLAAVLPAARARRPSP